MKSLNIQQLKHLPEFISRHRVIISWLLILLLFGFTLSRTLAISDPSHDTDYLEKQREEIQAVTIDIDEDLQKQIEGLLETKVDATPDNLGTRDPFSP